VVSLRFEPTAETLRIKHIVVPDPPAYRVQAWINAQSWPFPKVYIEQYRTRQRLNTDTRMVQLEQDLRRTLSGATFLPNMGIKRVITKELMEMLTLWTWSTVTHHQDLRSAARIALLGMVKDDDTNQLLADVVRASLNGRPWTVVHV
jgi:hypothetical protein